MKTEIKEIPFNEGTLLGVKTPDGKVWLGVRKACRDIGLTDAQAQAEVKKIESSLLFKGNWVKFDTVQREGNRDVKRKIVVLAEKFVPMWLAQINLTPAMRKKKPEAVQKLLTYQLEAAEVLHKAFYETEEQKDIFHKSMGLEGRILEMAKCLEGQTVQINNMENMICEQMEKLDSVMDNMTLSTRQQQKLYKAAKDRINHLLGGAHSQKYKENAKSYFINLWNNLKSYFHCGGSYKDLNPKYFDRALDYISTWRYVEK